MTERHWIFFRGSNRLRDNELFRLHGLCMEKGKIYPVDTPLYEYLKAIRGFEPCRGVGSKDTISFPKPKKVYETKSYKEARNKVQKDDKKDTMV